jgi:proline iminopeptidase
MKYTRILILLVCALCLVSFSANFYAVAAQTENTVRTSDGVTLHYKMFGKGVPVLVLSGNPGVTADYMLPVASELGKSHQAILLHPRGTGNSKMENLNPSNVGLKFSISDIETLREHLKIDKMIILGHSWGGGFAMAYAAQYPSRVQGLVLVSSVGFDMGYEKYWQDNINSRLLPSDFEAIASWSAPERMKANPDKAIFEIGKSQTMGLFFDRKNAAKLLDNITPESFNLRFARLMLADLSRSYNIKTAISNFKQPVLIVQGRQDPVDASTAYQTKETLTQAKIEFVEKCGHFPWLEQPEKFFPIVKDFLGTLK